jgi:hypothetical protein
MPSDLGEHIRRVGVAKRESTANKILPIDTKRQELPIWLMDAHTLVSILQVKGHHMVALLSKRPEGLQTLIPARIFSHMLINIPKIYN